MKVETEKDKHNIKNSRYGKKKLYTYGTRHILSTAFHLEYDIWNVLEQLHDVMI